MAVIVLIVVFWVLGRVILQADADVSEEHAACINQNYTVSQPRRPKSEKEVYLNTNHQFNA
jgi:hypothetical protein